MKELHKIQRLIIKNLIFQKDARFTDLKKDSKDIENNQFCFHLNSLLSEGIVSKDEDDFYNLSEKGRILSERMDTNDSKIKQQAKLTVYFSAINDKNEILIYTRKKNPFYNCQGFGGGKIDYGETIINAAKREFREETGMEGNPELIQILHFTTYSKNTDKLLIDKLMFFVRFVNPTGRIINTEEGMYEWVSLNEVKDYIKKPFSTKEEALNQIEYLVNWNGQITLEETKQVTENY